MATTQKTTLKRYNGSEWDPVYLANSADITYFADGWNVDTSNVTAWANGDNISANTTVDELIKAVINNLAKVGSETIPTLQDGTGITALNADVINTGTVSRTVLPADVSGKLVAVEPEFDLTTLTGVNQGDLVKVRDGKLYFVEDGTTTPATLVELTDNASDLQWSRIIGTPTDLDGYGIQDAVNVDEVAATSTPEAEKLLKTNADGKFEVDITGSAAFVGAIAAADVATKAEVNEVDQKATGISDRLTVVENGYDASKIKSVDGSKLDISVIPNAALERLVIVTNISVMQYDSTSPQHVEVEAGDTIKDQSTGQMYFVMDTTNLYTANYMDSLEEYTAATAGSVNWENVNGKPALVLEADVVNGDTKAPGKILALNADNKLDVDITGSAASVGTIAAADVATKAEVNIVAGDLTEVDGRVGTLETTVGDSTSGLVADVAANAAAINTINTTDLPGIKNGTLITAIDPAVLTDRVSYEKLPLDVAGKVITVASMDEAKTTDHTDWKLGDFVKDADGNVYIIVNTASLGSDAGYTLITNVSSAHVTWENVDGKPDLVLADDVVTVAEANKILRLDANGNLPTNITGSATSIDGTLTSANIATKTEVGVVDQKTVDNAEAIGTLRTDMDNKVENINPLWIKGILPLSIIPQGAQERLVPVDSITVMGAAGAPTVEAGDTIKDQDTGIMYYVTNADVMGTAEYATGLEVYTAGSASSVEWRNIEGIPAYAASENGLTNFITTQMTVAAGGAGTNGKILTLNADGKLAADITGHVEWANVDNGPFAGMAVADIDSALASATHNNRAVLDLLSDMGGYLAYNGTVLATKAQLDAVELGALKVVDTTEGQTAAPDQLVLEKIATA